MNQNINLDFNKIMEKANQEQCEVIISIGNDRTEITVQPWKPFVYTCPYQNKTDTRSNT
jgi:hypothetical protein